MKKPLTHQFLVIFGPTGVGKTAFVDNLAQYIPCEIINMDSGQFYKPLTIGTAKPDWHNSNIPHHLFDIIASPTLPTVVEYRNQVCELIKHIIEKGKLPILVGGSGFYLKSLLFPPCQVHHISSGYDLRVTSENALECWKELYAIDPKRATAIDPHDAYRIQRALDIWHQTGIKPSDLKPAYDPPGSYQIVYLYRDKMDLKNRIAHRTREMLISGWIEEVRSLTPEWISWIKLKKIIGYTTILDYLEGLVSYEEMTQQIISKTTQYAKKQEVFWRMLKKEITFADNSDKVTELNLTTADIHLYIMKLSELVALSTLHAK